jgi:hypothetical protein
VIRTLLVLVLVQYSALAQSGSDRRLDITGATAEPAVYTPLTATDRWRHLSDSTLSPTEFGVNMISAAVSHEIGSVPEWGHGAEGYGRRLGWTVLNDVAQSSIESGAAAALHEDNTYYRCSCSGLWRRTAHALVSQVTARRPDGTRSFSFSRPIGAYAGAMVATSVLPQRFTATGDGIRYGTWNYALGFPLNLFREFWPEIKRGVFGEK